MISLPGMMRSPYHQGQGLSWPRKIVVRPGTWHAFPSSNCPSGRSPHNAAKSFGPSDGVQRDANSFRACQKNTPFRSVCSFCLEFLRMRFIQRFMVLSFDTRLWHEPPHVSSSRLRCPGREQTIRKLILVPFYHCTWPTNCAFSFLHVLPLIYPTASSFHVLQLQCGGVMRCEQEGHSSTQRISLSRAQMEKHQSEYVWGDFDVSFNSWNKFQVISTVASIGTCLHFASFCKMSQLRFMEQCICSVDD